jgi:hypothetical protein
MRKMKQRMRHGCVCVHVCVVVVVCVVVCVVACVYGVCACGARARRARKARARGEPPPAETRGYGAGPRDAYTAPEFTGVSGNN